MSTSDQPWPPKHLGDFPHGVYWSAERPTASGDADALDLTVEGDVIRFMWDFGVVVPLWDGNGLVAEEREWLRSALGISDALISDLREWGIDMSHLDANPSLRMEDAYRDLDRRARALVERLREEVGSRFKLEYKPWVTPT